MYLCCCQTDQNKRHIHDESMKYCLKQKCMHQVPLDEECTLSHDTNLFSKLPKGLLRDISNWEQSPHFQNEVLYGRKSELFEIYSYLTGKSAKDH